MDDRYDQLIATRVRAEKGDVLLKMARPDIYRVNAFRILDLPVTASPKEISAHARKLDLMEKFGDVEHTNSAFLSLTPPPDSDVRSKAQQRLRDPELRFIDEFFWFWPLSSHLPEAQDEALVAMRRGDLSSALSIWERREAEGSEANVSMHNLAVLHHTLALDLERLEVDREPSKKQIEEKRSYWEQAFSRWLMLLNDNGFWGRVSERIRELDDPRLTTGMVRRIREGLPAALLSINAMLAVEAAEMDDPTDAIYHLRLMQHPGFDNVAIDAAMQRAVMPIRDRINAVSTHAREESGKLPDQDGQLATDLMDHASPTLQILDLLLPEGNATRESAHDEVALQVRSCLISFCNDTQDWRTALKLAKRAAKIAESPSVRERLGEDVEAIKANLAYGTCWFCGKTPANETSILTVKMHGNVHRSGGQVSFQQLDVPVPRCKDCKYAHERRRYLGFGGVIIGIILAVAIGIASESALTGFIIFGAFGIGGAVLAQLSFPQGIKPESHKENFRTVREMKSHGWRTGEKPEGVQ